MKSKQWMKLGMKLALFAPLLLSGCKGFWNPVSSSDFSLSNSGAVNVSSPGAASGNTATITVTPSSSFTGTVDLTCTVATSPSGASSPVTCSLSPTSVTTSGSTAQTASLTASTTSATTTGTYEITVTGTSGSASATTTVCVVVGSSSGNCSSSASASGNFYILSNTSISGYSIQGGGVTALSGSSSSVTAASAIAIGPSGTFLYLSTGNGILLYAINTGTGALSQQGTPVSPDTEAAAIQVDPSGKWLLDASASGTLYAIPITSTGAQDTSRSVQSQVLAGPTVQPGGIAISHNGTLIAVALGSKGTEAFPLAATSTNSPIGNPYSNILTPYGSAGSAVAVAIDPQNRFLYIGETVAFPSSTTNSGALRVFTMGSNSLTEFTYTNSTPYAPTGTGPHAILPISTGGYVYVASWQSGSEGVITGYAVSTSALTPLANTSATGTQPDGLAEDSSSNYLLAVSNSGTTLSAYTIESATGQLGSPLTSSSVSRPVAIVAAP